MGGLRGRGMGREGGGREEDEGEGLKCGMKSTNQVVGCLWNHCMVCD